jgi:hypothetical protein
MKQCAEICITDIYVDIKVKNSQGDQLPLRYCNGACIEKINTIDRDLKVP